MANKGNDFDVELPSDPSSSSLSSKKTTEKNEKPEEIDTKQHLDMQKKDIEKDKQHKERQLEETIQKQSTQRNDPKSNPDLNTTVESVNSSEPKKEKEEETIQEQSSHRNDQESNPDLDTTSENCSEPVEKQKEETIQGQSSHTNDQESNPDLNTTVESVNSSEPKKEQEEETIQEQSSHRNDQESNPDLDTTSENCSEPVEKQKVTSSHQDMTSSGFPQSQTEIVPEKKKEMTPNLSSCQTRNDSDTKPHPQSMIKVDEESDNKTDKKEKGSEQHGTSSGLPQISRSENVQENEKSPLNIQKPEEEEAEAAAEEEEEETARDINEENVERDESEVQDQDQNLQPQIIVPGNNKTFWICAVGVILLAVVCAFMCSPDLTPPKTNELNVVDVFNQEMEKLETSFPNQRPELWRRSLIHLRRHLKTKNPSEPVSLILTSGHRAEKTLDCLARCLARAFTTARNSSVLNINGKSKASQDSDQVKLDIDRELRNAFDGEKSAAVIHRFEELPPGSTLIFYRYCDHENAAYKNVFLAFTVMLDAEVEVSSNVSLGRVEEMVQEHIKQKFVSSDKSAVFNQMDVDKLSGLWSRISHLILPVAAEEKIEQQGCGDCDKSF